MVLTNVILPVFFIIFLGFLLRRFGKVDLKTFSRAQLYVLSPALAFMSLAKPEADTGLILRVLFFIVCLEAVLIVISLGIGFAMKRGRAERQAMTLASVLMNTGFYGIPVCVLAFGDWGLVYATIYMVASSITQSTIGIFLASAGHGSSKEALANVFKTPLLWSIVAARLLVYLHALTPAPLMKMIDMLGASAIPIGLILLGMQLESIWLESAAWRASLAGRTAAFSIGENHEGVRPEGTCKPGPGGAVELRRDISGGLVSAAIRIVGGLVVSYGIIQLFHFNANMNQVLIVESSMPTAVNAIVFATEYNCRPRLVAVGILASTLASVVSITLILRYLGS
ncbi:MAG: AEC family transporter [Candidatus Krumholzibacteria bacterium]|nr:AEC family transporter [Candidatus Krumholzibacteria bacterium]